MKYAIDDCWFLSGPTASGKTAIGLELALALDAEIISLDSMAIYRGMDIGTAKPTDAQQRRVPHYLIDIVDPDQEFSQSAYVDAAHDCIREICSRGRKVLFVGGTPLYLKSMLRGIFEGPPADWEFRRSVELEVREVGTAALHARLQQVDPLSARRLHPNDVRRIVRALEVYKLTGTPISHQQLQFDEGRSADECQVFVLQWQRELLHERIAQRVDRMFAEGLVDEIRQLQATYRRFGRTASQAVGYREVLQLLAGQVSELATIEKVKARTRRFAKRQRTWFRGLSECRMVPLDAQDAPAAVAERILAAGVGS